MELIELECRNCGGALSASDVSMELSMVRCPNCQSIYALKAESKKSDSPSNDLLKKPTIDTPKGFVVSDSGRELEITQRWYTPLFFGLLFFALFWNGFLVVWHFIALGTGAWFMSLFAGLHTLVGMGLIYVVACGFLNSTVVRVSGGVLTVRHGPLPWFGNLELDASSLKQLYAKEKVTQGKNGPSYHYSLFGVDHSGTRRAVLKRLQSVEQAVFFEQRIEHFLNIEDQPVRGEAPL